MRRYLPRFKLGRLLLAVAIATPLSAAFCGYVTGVRCPLCFSGRVIPVFHGLPMCRVGEMARRGEIHLGKPQDSQSATRWYCRACELEW
jgi:hypothetical protein